MVSTATNQTLVPPPGPASPQASELAVITVTFHPDLERLGRQIDALPPDAWLVVIDNASAPGIHQELLQRLARRPKTHLIENNSNEGLAKALNRGADYASTHIDSTQYLLLMDQDSVPFPNAIERLLAAHAALEKRGVAVGCVGPRLIDKGTGLQHGFHRIKGWRWFRVYPTEEDRTPVSCSNLNGSGTLLKAELFRKLGGLDETFFIDHVDTEWAFHVLASGYLLFGIPDAQFDHAMGERSRRFWCFGWRIWPQRSPQRHYYLFRNALWLMRRHYVPIVWKVWAAAKLGLTIIVQALVQPKRGEQLQKMLLGAANGIREPTYARVQTPPRKY